ncbi:uncharacterized protein [Battus philenor]|uniref:uncharacterized protein isoform X1 n=1 Tax=Battus philenor TaxID=42288 RepID=UPI0035CF72AB
MALIMEGNNLGEKHKYFNNLVKETIRKKTFLDIDDSNSVDIDLRNLINIDVANETRNVDYILNILTCDDMLYVTRALKKCDWLITDELYADIINPENLNLNLYPRMQTKAITKLKQLIRLKLQDESRAEQFYNFEEKSSEALKWLPKCSVQFIEDNFHKHARDMNLSFLKRLCEKSEKVLEIYIKSCPYSGSESLQRASFLLHFDADKFLNIVESQPSYNYPNFGKRTTKVLMTKCPKRIIENFGDYCCHIDTPTFVKYLKKEDLQTFVIKKIINAEDRCYQLMHYFNNYNNWNYFLAAIPRQERYDFIDNIFLNDRVSENESELTDVEKVRKFISTQVSSSTPVYYWYRFISFDVAFSKIKNMMGPETDAYHKNEMFATLFASAKGNLENGKCLLQYFRDKHIKSSQDMKITFLNNFIKYFEIYRLDKDSWVMFEDIVNSVDMKDSTENISTIIETIMISKIVRKENVPDKIENLFNFNSLKTYQYKLNTKEKEDVFNYLQQIVMKKIENIVIRNKSDFEQCVESLKTMMTLINDWNKDITSYPFILDKIKHLNELKQEKSWSANMSSLYNLQKSWRKYMFNQSILLSPTEEVCINYLKHGPNILELYKREIQEMLFNDKISLKRLLRKVRIYWPQSFNSDWQVIYLNGLNQSEGQNAITKGLCILLPKYKLSAILKKYAPENPKIDWDNIQEHELGLQKNFAKNMHNARPQLSLENVLLYAKGDYLQHALPSLLAVLYNLSSTQCQDYLPVILDTPVSLQKHGIRCVFTKISPEKLKETFKVLWVKTNNSTIRTEIFKITFDLLVNEKNELKIQDIWGLLEIFIDNLKLNEDKAIYKLLFNIEKIPENVKASFLIKSYKFLKTLIAHSPQEYSGSVWDIKKLARSARQLMSSLPSSFVADIITEFIDTLFFKERVQRHNMTNLISSYLLCAKDEDTQMKKYNEILAPLLKRLFNLINDCPNQEHHVRLNFDELISNLITDLKLVTFEQNMVIPLKMFSQVLTELQQALPLCENYVLIRKWELATKMVMLLETNPQIPWEENCLKVAPQLGKYCESYLKEDTASLFPCVYILFARVLEIFENILSNAVKYEIYNLFVQDKDFVQGYLVVLRLIKRLRGDDVILKAKTIQEEIRRHPSAEVKMHYYDVFPEDRAYLFTITKKG